MDGTVDRLRLDLEEADSCRFPKNVQSAPASWHRHRASMHGKSGSKLPHSKAQRLHNYNYALQFSQKNS
jgi:hypothetical protein